MLQPIDLTQEEQLKATLGCPVLDGFLRGGIPCGSVTEITGEAAAGKSQLALQSLLTVQLPLQEGGLNGKAVYIYTEGKPPVERLQSILSSRFKGRTDVSLAHVLIEERPIGSPDDLLRSVRQLTALLERETAAAGAAGAATATATAAGSGGRGAPGPAAATAGPRKVRLIVIDSVAHVFRDVGDGDQPQVQQLHRRAAQLFGLSALLKRLAQQHQLAVLLTNQIMDDVLNSDSNKAALEQPGLPGTLRGAGGGGGGGGGSRAAALVSSGRRVLPALGLAWSNCVNCRLFAARHDAWGGGVIRSLQVVFAPHLPHSYCCFQVDADGVWGVDDDDGDGGAAAEQGGGGGSRGGKGGAAG